MESYKPLTVLAVSVTVLLGYNFMSAAWTAPAGSPPNNNTEAPVNVGPTDQSKSGALGASEFQSNRYCTANGELCFSPQDVVVDPVDPIDTSTFLNTSSVAQRKAGVLTLGGLLIEGAGTIASAGPKIKFEDTDSGAIDFWAHANSNSFYILTDRNLDAVFDAPNPLRLFTGATPADDYAAFPNQVRAAKYCNAAGSKCGTIDDFLNDSDDANQVVKSGTVATDSWTLNKWEGDSGWHYDYFKNVVFSTPFVATPVVTFSKNSGSGNARCVTTIDSITKTGFRFSVKGDQNLDSDNVKDCGPHDASWIAAGQ